MVNVGAGTGSYEPVGRNVLAIEPSAVMRAQRPADAAPCIEGVAEALPLADASQDAATAVLTIHHWTDQAAGLRELRRVARHRVVILTWVPDFEEFWLTRDYFPEIAEHDRDLFPPTERLHALVEETIGPASIEAIPIPADCVDGFLAAYWRRPSVYLDPDARAAISSFSYFDPAEGVAKLARDLTSGRWSARNAALLDRGSLDLGYRLIRCELDHADSL